MSPPRQLPPNGRWQWDFATVLLLALLGAAIVLLLSAVWPHSSDLGLGDHIKSHEGR